MVLVGIGRLVLGFFEALIQCLARYAQAQSRNGLIAAGSFQGFNDQQLLDLFECGQLMRETDQCTLFGRCVCRIVPGNRMFFRNVGFEQVHGQLAGCVAADRIKNHGFKLSDVAGEMIG